MKSYHYKMSEMNALGALIVGGGLLAFSIYAIIESWGVSVYGVTLPPEKAQYIYMVLASIGGVTLFLSAMLKSIGSRVIRIDADSVTVPKSELSKKMIAINFTDIQGLEVSSYNDIQTLEINHSDRKTKIRSPHFESLETFFDFSDTVANAING